MHELSLIGWRERLSLPLLGLQRIKAKIDTGARTSVLHVSWLEESERDGTTWLRFGVSTRRKLGEVVCEAPAIDRREVTDSGGHTTLRWFIRSTIELAERRFEAEINLTNRGSMLFPMLLGRSALANRFVVNPNLSYVYRRRRARVRSGETP